MILHEINSIYIHIPKTAGNFLTKKLFFKLSNDRITVKGNQDGQNRFGVQGELTFKKHMSLFEYASLVNLRDYYCIASVRDPVDRLISFYFSPHRGYQKNLRGRAIAFIAKLLNVDITVGSTGYHNTDIAFDATSFKAFCDKLPSQSDFLKGYQDCKKLFLIDQKTIEEDTRQLYTFFGLDPEPLDAAFSQKTSRVNESLTIISDEQRKQCEEIVMASHHFADVAFLQALKPCNSAAEQ